MPNILRTDVAVLSASLSKFGVASRLAIALVNTSALLLHSVVLIQLRILKEERTVTVKHVANRIAVHRSGIPKHIAYTDNFQGDERDEHSEEEDGRDNEHNDLVDHPTFLRHMTILPDDLSWLRRLLADYFMPEQGFVDLG